MDKAIFIKELRDIFSGLNEKDKRYSKVWLSDADFGGLYQSGKYNLYLKAQNQIPRNKTEISFLIDLLDQKLDKDKVPYIFNIEVFNTNEYARPDRDDIILYNDELIYNAA